VCVFLFTYFSSFFLSFLLSFFLSFYSPFIVLFFVFWFGRQVAKSFWLPSASWRYPKAANQPGSEGATRASQI
jgi:hypothetical protein